MAGFTVVDLSAQCEIHLHAHYEYDLLQQLPGAAELIGACSSELWKNPESFEFALDGSDEDPLIVRWRASSESTGIASLRNRAQILSVSMLVAGSDPEADRSTLDSFQQFAVVELRNTPFEPAFDLSQIPYRPLLATVGLFVPENPLLKESFALADRCFAAAYFRKLQIV